MVCFEEIAETDVGIVGLKPTALILGAVGAVIVHQHNFVLVVGIVVFGNALQNVVYVLVAIVCTENN